MDLAGSAEYAVPEAVSTCERSGGADALELVGLKLRSSASIG